MQMMAAQSRILSIVLQHDTCVDHKRYHSADVWPNAERKLEENETMNEGKLDAER